MLYLNKYFKFKESVDLSNPMYLSSYVDKDKKIIEKFLELYELYQSNHFDNFNYNYFHKIYFLLPIKFRELISYNGKKILYRGQETSNIPDRKILSFSKSKKVAEFIGNKIITNKEINYNYTVDSEKIY